MYILKEVQTGNVFHLKASNYTIGRAKECSIENNKSVSRVHATITVESIPIAKLYEIEASPKIYVTDQSKFGTFIRTKGADESSVRVKTGEKHYLKSGDTVQFGTNFSNTYILEYKPIIFCCSNIRADSSLKQEIDKCVSQLCSHMTEDLSIAHFLIMSELRVTAKVISALVEQIPIINFSFLEAALKLAISDPISFLEPFHYLPPSKSSNTLPREHFKLNSKRKTLFLGLTFVFQSQEQYEKTGEIVSGAGGTVIKEFEGEKIPQEGKILIVDSNKENSRNFIIVDDNQIGMAILTTDLTQIQVEKEEAPKIEKPKKVKPPTPPEPEEEKVEKEEPKSVKKVETVVGTKSEFRDPDMVVTATDAAQIESTSLVVNKKRAQVVDEPQSNIVNFKKFRKNWPTYYNPVKM